MESVENLTRELQQERAGRQQAADDADAQRRVAQGLHRLLLALGSEQESRGVLSAVLKIFAEVAGVDVGALRLREGSLLRSRAAIGTEEERATEYTVPLDETFSTRAIGGGALLHKTLSPADDVSEPYFRARGVHQLEVVLLQHQGDLVGALYLGLRPDQTLSSPAANALNAMANGAAAVVIQALGIDALRNSVTARDTILGVVAHDLRNPLTSISLAANNLIDGPPSSPGRRAAGRILRAVQRADRLIQDLLEVNAIEGGQFSIEAGAIDVATTLLATLESQQSIAASASIILASDISPDLPLIEADEERLVEVLENLIGNAIKFTPAGGTVTVGANARESEVLLWVKDTGAGIRPDQLGHLFDRFWQAQRKDRRGTGLGLTICKAIVEAHGGRIWADSRIGGGTTLLFTIPSAAKSANAARPAVVNILVVDDRPENLLSLKAILERPDYRLVTASSGEEALGIALKEDFSVALIDIAMPVMNGLEVAVHLKEFDRTRHIPIIFITAFGDDPQEIHRAYTAGGADYLVKPLDAEIVRKKVAVFAELTRRRQGTKDRRTWTPRP